eukprot:12564098-Prorocentrum_lima.AAC.1
MCIRDSKWHTRDQRWYHSPRKNKIPQIPEEARIGNKMVPLYLAPEAENLIKYMAALEIDQEWNYGNL